MNIIELDGKKYVSKELFDEVFNVYYEDSKIGLDNMNTQLNNMKTMAAAIGNSNPMQDEALKKVEDLLETMKAKIARLEEIKELTK